MYKTNISINIHGDSEIEGTEWADFVAFFSVCIGILLLIFGTIVIVKKRNTNMAIKSKNVNLLIVMAVSGVIHIWSALISNNQFFILSYIEHTTCVLWNYWLQYLFGLCLWFIAVFLRLITYHSIFSRRLTNIGFSRLNRYKWVVGLVIGGPLVLLFSFLSFTHGQYYDESLERCRTFLIYKVLLTLWIFSTSILLVTYAFFVRKDIQKDFHYEFRPLAQIVIVGITILIINSNIIFLGLLNFSYTRSIATFNIVVLHIFSFYRICGYVIYKALRKDNFSTYQFLEENQEFSVDLNFVSEFKDDDQAKLIQDFLDYCSKQPQFYVPNSNNQIVNPANYVQCYKDVIKWKKEFVKNLKDLGETEMSKRQQKIIEKYLGGAQAETYIYPDFEMITITANAVLNNWAFDDIEKWIWKTLDKKFGTNYIQNDITTRLIYLSSDSLKEKIEKAKRSKAMTRLSHTNLLDCHNSVLISEVSMLIYLDNYYIQFVFILHCQLLQYRFHLLTGLATSRAKFCQCWPAIGQGLPEWRRGKV